jgi:hypothetical protein
MQIDDPIEMVAYWAELAAKYPYEQRLGDVPYLGRPQGASSPRGRGRGPDHALERPPVPQHRQARPRARRGLHGGAEAGARHTWCATTLGRLVAEKTDIPPAS